MIVYNASLEGSAELLAEARPHRTLSQQPPDGKIPVTPADDNIRVRRRDRLGGLIHEYSQVA